MLLIVIALISSITCQVLEERADYLKLQLFQDPLIHTFSTFIFVGSPPQQQLVMVDTGSPYLLLKEQSCTSCSKANLPFFQQAASTTFNKTNCYDPDQFSKCITLCPQDVFKRESCTYSVTYGITNFYVTLFGQLGNDQIRFSENISSTTVVSTVASSFNQSESENRVDENGLLGVSPFAEISLMYDWMKHKGLSRWERKLSLCLNKDRGYMEWGNTTGPQYESNITYSPYSNHFNVLVQSIKMQDQNLLNVIAMERRKGVMIDSGSSGCVFPQAEYAKVVQILNARCKELSSCKQLDLNKNMFGEQSTIKASCYQFSSLNYFTYESFVNQNYPNISIKINGSSFDLLPSKYLPTIFEDYTGYKVACLKMMPSAINQYILGVPWMMDKKITFNLDSNNPTLSIINNYQCFDPIEQILQKLSKGWAGYLIVLAIFLCMVLSQKVYDRIRGARVRKDLKFAQY